MRNNIEKLLCLVKKEKPLIHLITNSVTRNDCANIALAIGASPIMAMAIEEVEDVISASKALVLNIGTIEKETAKSMIKAGQKANSLDIPVILDPVGVGVSMYRRRVVEEILEHVHISIIKGNASEIKTIYGLKAKSKGVDSVEEDDIDEMKKISQNLSKRINSVVGITGKIDVVSFIEETVLIYNGHKMLKSITGTGCMCTTLIGAFSSVATSMLDAALGGILCLDIAGEIAYEKTKKMHGGSGSFKMHLFDAIYNLKEEDILKIGKIID